MFGARPNSQFDAFTQFHVPLAAFDQVFVVNTAWAIGLKVIPNRMAISVARNLDVMGDGFPDACVFMPRDRLGRTGCRKRDATPSASPCAIDQSGARMSSKYWLLRQYPLLCEVPPCVRPGIHRGAKPAPHDTSYTGRITVFLTATGSGGYAVRAARAGRCSCSTAAWRKRASLSPECLAR